MSALHKKHVVTNGAWPRNRRLLVWMHLLDTQKKPKNIHASWKLITCVKGFSVYRLCALALYKQQTCSAVSLP